MLFAQSDFTWQEAFNYGLPTVLLLMGSLALWRGAIWFRNEVVKPVVAAHVRMMNTFSEHMPKQTEAMAGLKQSVDKLNAGIINLCRYNQEHHHVQTKI